MAEYSERDLARAKRARERKLEQMKALVETCTCCWPIVTYRNLHGHDSKCPYVELWQKWRDEAEEARDDAGY